MGNAPTYNPFTTSKKQPSQPELGATTVNLRFGHHKKHSVVESRQNRLKEKSSALLEKYRKTRQAKLAQTTKHRNTQNNSTSQVTKTLLKSLRKTSNASSRRHQRDDSRVDHGRSSQLKSLSLKSQSSSQKRRPKSRISDVSGVKRNESKSAKNKYSKQYEMFKIYSNTSSVIHPMAQSK